MTTKVKSTPKAKSINLYDVLPIFKPSKSTNNVKKEEIADYVELKNSLTSLESSLRTYFNKDTTVDLIRKAMNANDVASKMFRMRNNFLSDHNYLPEPMQTQLGITDVRYNSTILTEERDNLTKMSKSPKILGKDVKAIVDKFGFIAIPVECLNEKSYENEFWTTKKEITNFGKNLDNYNVYVITPIEYYSLENHVYKNTEEKGIYAGNHTMVFTSVIINIPMFRSMLNTIAGINDGVNKLKTENSTIKQSLQQIDATLKNLQRLVDQQQTQLIQQQLKIKEQTESLQRFEQMALRVIDPVMIAFDKRIDINSDKFDTSCCFVGPCWGPDFDEAVSLALDLKIVKNQRSTLNKSSSELWN